MVPLFRFSFIARPRQVFCINSMFYAFSVHQFFIVFISLG